MPSLENGAPLHAGRAAAVLAPMLAVLRTQRRSAEVLAPGRRGVCRLHAAAPLLLAAVALSSCGTSDQAQPPAGRPTAAVAAVAAPTPPPIEIWRPGEGRPRPKPLDFVSLEDRLSTGSVQLSSGQEVFLSDWQALKVSSTVHGDCTSTIIGPRALLTAAHCVDAELPPGTPGPQTLDSRLRIRFGPNDVRDFTARCDMHPTYAASPITPLGGTRASQDYALCSLDRTVSGLEYETLAMDNPLAQGAAILMSGFGCTNIAVDTSGRLTFARGDDRLRMGDERIAFTGVRGATEANGVYVLTKAEGSEPILCPGDSGGPAFTGATLQNQRAPRRVRAVNSAVGWSPRPGGGWDFYSYLSPLGTTDFRSFLESWLALERNRGQIICGHNRAAGIGGCRA